MPSPRPKPTRLKLLEGNPGKRPLNENEVDPDVESCIPDPPDQLSDIAKKEWLNMGEKLHRLGLLTEIDYTAFSFYCQAYARWIEAEGEIKKTGLVIKTTNGNFINSPYVGIANTSMRDCHRYLIEFGMTPSSRTKVEVKGVSKKSKFDGLIGGRN